MKDATEGGPGGRDVAGRAEWHFVPAETAEAIVATNILTQVRNAAKQKILFLPHAVGQMVRPDRMITTREVELVVTEGELVEDYPEDARGHSCLLLGRGDEGRAIHVVCSPGDEYLAVITAYLPDTTCWSSDFKRRL